MNSTVEVAEPKLSSSVTLLSEEKLYDEAEDLQQNASQHSSPSNSARGEEDKEDELFDSATRKRPRPAIEDGGPEDRKSANLSSVNSFQSKGEPHTSDHSSPFPPGATVMTALAPILQDTKTEQSYLIAFQQLSAEGISEKIKSMEAFAYRLGHQEAKEMERGRNLNVLSPLSQKASPSSAPISAARETGR
eukprot:TRINITY_DN9020_c0_g1_i1.p1 TRINITY_DN9020_c0_g1~~TRINITY_DN9020_c0_g1_i1.p1  ORF type:complete len:191 (-),score=37.54 TRINITY_DN9020_c0_g1_i1:205-777(-)